MRIAISVLGAAEIARLSAPRLVAPLVDQIARELAVQPPGIGERDHGAALARAVERARANSTPLKPL